MNIKIVIFIFIFIFIFTKLINNKESFVNLRKPDKVAFCFLTYSGIEHNNLWKKFFKNGDSNKYSIFSHVKNVSKKTPKWIKKNMIPTIPTSWCGKNLPVAFINMLKKAIKDKDNKYFVLLSGSCIPLYNFDTTYKKILLNKKSLINFKERERNKIKWYWGSQWVILNRKTAKIFINLYAKPEGLKLINDIDKSFENGFGSCPDEIYPINWFIKILGDPRKNSFKKLIKNKISTYVLWNKKIKYNSHPIKFDLEKVKKYEYKIYNSGALFARKFTKKAAEYISKI